MLQNYVISELQLRNIISGIALSCSFMDTTTSQSRSNKFLFLSYLSSKVHTSDPQSVSEMKDDIKREIIQIPPDILSSTLLSAISRMQCIVCKMDTLKTCNYYNFFPFSLLHCH